MPKGIVIGLLSLLNELNCLILTDLEINIRLFITSISYRGATATTNVIVRNYI